MPEALTVSTLSRAYARAELEPESVLVDVYERISAMGESPIWIAVVKLEAALEALRSARERRSKGEQLPLFGIPFAVKDNIDVASMPTTAGCPAFASTPPEHAPVVASLIDAGAILIGKTNLDQFATGLVGTRSPYGACASMYNKMYISGGSSSGSALAVAHGLVSFALGTDTAGSGRIPAAFNHLVGLKPTRGLVSTRGVVPACRTLDCVSVFTATVGDAALVLDVIQAFDALDPYSRLPAEVRPEATGTFQFGVLKADQREFFGNAAYAGLYQESILRCQALGGAAVEVDLTPFLQAAALLYDGPWVAERYAAVGAFIEQHPNEIEAIVREIVLGAKHITASEGYRAQYKLATLQRAAQRALDEVAFLLLPTAPTHYTLSEVAADPLRLNANLGRYTNFVNLLDLAAVAVPAAFTDAQLPFGVTLVGKAWSEPALLQYAARFCGEPPTPGPKHTMSVPPPTPATVPHPQEILLAVAGAHLTGQPLNYQLTQLGARMIRSCRTASSYRFYALAGTTPPKPGLVHAPDFRGNGIEVEIWALDPYGFGSFVADVPAPMVIGTVTLDDGSRVKGFLCEPFALQGAREITGHGGWRSFLTAQVD